MTTKSTLINQKQIKTESWTPSIPYSRKEKAPMFKIQHFKEHLERLGYSATMVFQLPNHVQTFLAYQEHTAVESITSSDIVRFYNHLRERPNKRKPGALSESYINHHVYALKLFFAWQEEKGAITENPISSLEFKSPTSKPREILTLAEIKELYELCENYKERAVLSIYYGCGLRRNEGEKLNLKDIHFRANLLYVREGKGNKRRAVPLSEKVKEDLWHYALETRDLRNETRNKGAFLLNDQGGRMRGDTSNKVLKELLQRVGIKKEVSLHCLRHSIATHLLESGLPVEYVRDFLGHKHLESTQIYTRINKQQLWNLSSI